MLKVFDWMMGMYLLRLVMKETLRKMHELFFFFEMFYWKRKKRVGYD